MAVIMETLSVLALLVFVIGSMASMGLSLKINQIITPLKNIKLVILEEKIVATQHANLLLWRRWLEC
jgi:hypothetical protein